jgi:CheY-like chemotaxis protein
VLAGLRILVVEDEVDTRTALSFVLEACGATVLPVGTAGEAWAFAFGAASPDVIVSDIGLPDEDGCSFMRRFRHRESDQGRARMTAIALTAHTAPRDRARALLSGFDRHVRKPIAFEELVAAIASMRSGAPR